MHICLLTRFHSRHQGGSFLARLATAAQDQGHTVAMINPGDCAIKFIETGGNTCPVLWNGQSFPQADLILPYARSNDTFTWQLAETLRSWGQPVATHTHVPLSDSVTMARLFARRNISTPRSWVLDSEAQFTVILPELTFPCVIRSRTGGRGRQVTMANHTGEAYDMVRRFCQAGQPFLVQELPQPWGQDVRVMVVGNRIVAAVRRQALEGFSRPRETANRQVEEVTLTEMEQRVALTAAQIYGAPFCAVSLLRPATGGDPLLLEVSCAPLLEEVEQVTHIDIAAQIVQHLVALASTLAYLTPTDERASATVTPLTHSGR